MIVDTSALVSILTGGADADPLLRALVTIKPARISAATLCEATTVLDSRTAPQQRRRLDDLLDLAGVEVVSFDQDQAALARQAYIDFGRGSGHPARLNLGDCFAYALHRTTGEPVLFKGTDFAAAGVPNALDP
ncbi:type II toxin-antitoxin system VapC family toxin [Ornithinimicrobium ciconiae]|uniref:Ribonuclease VapC n=1 Tax=Ornithinimicrobium ciconiae TaxID=2594265 RepID=A0A516G7G2_9MICO|nr:type II toxin-antitoxin system VapC family toxin [Ornithinimicrobium ciconiae]QDO87463.1 type II toxin-antitoxin system VapC family toxin [Ornithinimicrobium ciconiae]